MMAEMILRALTGSSQKRLTIDEMKTVTTGLLCLLAAGAVAVLLGGCAASRPSPDVVIDQAISAVEASIP